MALLDKTVRLLALASGSVLIFLMLFTVLDVVLRYFFNVPFSGSLEITEFAMALIVFLSLAYCGWTGSHIAVDLFEKTLERPSLRFLPAIISLLGGLLFAAVAWRMTVDAIDGFSQSSNMMSIPYYPFRLAGALGSAIFSLVLLAQAWQGISKGNSRKEGSDVA